MKRAAKTQPAPGGTSRIEAFAAAATTVEIMNRRRGSTRSARPSVALASVPATNPTCTKLVNSDTCSGVSACSRRMEGTTADAENQSASAATWQSASRAIEKALPRVILATASLRPATRGGCGFSCTCHFPIAAG